MRSRVVFERSRLVRDVLARDPDAHHEVARKDMEHAGVLVQALLRAFGEHQAVARLSAARKDGGCDPADGRMIEDTPGSLRVQVVLADPPVGHFPDATPLLGIELYKIGVRDVNPIALVENDIRDSESRDGVTSFPYVVDLADECVDELGVDEARYDDVAVLAPLAQHRCAG